MRIPNFLQETNTQINDIYSRGFLVKKIINYIELNSDKTAVRIWIYWKRWIWKTYLLNEIKNNIEKYNSFFKPIFSRKKVIFLKTHNITNFQELYSSFVNDIIYSYSCSSWFIHYSIKLFFFIIPISIIGFILIFLFQVIKFESNTQIYITVWWTIASIIFIWVINSVIKSFSNTFISKDLINSLNTKLNIYIIIRYLLIKKWEWHKVTLILDDLDRINPKFLPEILLRINRISSIDKWIVNIILSADQEIISQWIRSSNIHYNDNSWAVFLEKIIDTPYHLNDLNFEWKYHFWNTHKNQLFSDYVWFKEMETILSILPDNIRQLKRYFRFVYTHISDLKRYSQSEINIKAIFIVFLMKLENVTKAKNVIEKVLNDKNIRKISFTSEKEVIEEALKSYTDFEKKYLSELLWIISDIKELDLIYRFDENSTIITNKEFHEYVTKKIWLKKWHQKLLNIHWWDNVTLLKKLIYYKNFYYERIVSSELNSESKVNVAYVKKIYQYISKTIKKIDWKLSISNESLNEIILWLSEFKQFKNNKEKLEMYYETHRKIEKWFILEIVKITEPEILFNNKDIIQSSEIEGIGLVVENIYWEYIIKNFSKRNFWNQLMQTKNRDFFYNRITDKKMLSDLKSVQESNNRSINYFYLIYWILLKNISHNNSKNRSVSLVIKSHRLLWSFLEEVILPRGVDYDTKIVLKEIKEKIIDITSYKLK